jgi:hypothetical protein
MAYLMVQYQYATAITDQELEAQSSRLAPCLEARDVKWVQTYVSKDRTRQLCIFQAADAETVRQAFRTANVAFVEVWPAFTPWT